MSDKAVTLVADPEYTVEFDGKETYVMRHGVKLAMRRDDRWVSIEPGVTVRDIVENGRHGIEVEYRRVTTTLAAMPLVCPICKSSAQELARAGGLVSFFLGFRVKMQPQTTIAAMAATKSPSCISCGIVVSSVA